MTGAEGAGVAGAAGGATPGAPWAVPGEADWAATPGDARKSRLEAAMTVPANSFCDINNSMFNVGFISSMTGESRIPCGPDGLPASLPSVADEKQAAKKALRKALRTARGALDPAIKVQWDAHIGAQVVAWWRMRQVSTFGVYWPLAGEPDLRAAYAELHHAGVRLALPVVMERDAPLTFTEWTPGEPMLTDEAGVQVPAQLRFIERPPALLIPCLGFNAEGYRLGYGGGYYDRTLELSPRPHTLGIAYSNQKAVFSHAPHDVPLDVIVTETSNVT
jgi:5,10-methenyltetrahydrofolate synthetase